MAFMNFSIKPEGTLIQIENKQDQMVNKENFGPLDHFLAGIGACMFAGVTSYGRKNELPVENITMTLSLGMNSTTRLVEAMNFVVNFPADFPEEHKAAMLQNMNNCYVKRHLYNPPTVTVKEAE